MELFLFCAVNPGTWAELDWRAVLCRANAAGLSVAVAAAVAVADAAILPAIVPESLPAADLVEHALVAAAAELAPAVAPEPVRFPHCPRLCPGLK